MSTPVRPRKYSIEHKPTMPQHTWSPVLGKLIRTRDRSRLFAKHGYHTVPVAKGKVHVLSAAKKQALVGSRIPFELTTTLPGVYELTVHQIRHPTRRRSVSARVALYAPGGTVMEFENSATICAQVVAVQAWPIHPPHLQRLAVGNARAAQDIIADAGSSSLILTACPTAKQPCHSATQVVVLPYHSMEGKWVCPDCGKLFKTASDLAKHDGAELKASRPKPRLLLANGKLGPFFTPPQFHQQHSWKQQALQKIEEGNVLGAMNMAPTLKHKSTTDTLLHKLIKCAGQR